MVRNQISSLNMNTKFKRTPIGDLPVDWEVMHLAEVADIYGGGTPDTANPEFWDGEVHWATPTDITALKSNFISSTKNKITEEGLKNSSAKLLPANSILMTSRATVGYCAINTVPMATNQGFANFVSGDKINNKYLLYLLISKRKDIERLGAGSTFLEVSKSSLKKVLIQVPDKKEQQSIAEILESVDTAIEKSSAVIEKTKQLKNGLMQQLLTRGIGHKEFKKTPIGEIPKGWELKKLGQLCLGKPEYGANVSALEYQKNLPRYIRITDIRDDGNLIQGDPKSIKKEDAIPYMLNEGDFLFARSGATVGKTYLYRKSNGECAFAGYMIRFRLDKSQLLPEYLFQLTHSDYYYQWVKGMLRAGAQPNVNATEYSELNIAVPPTNEQEQILGVLSAYDKMFQNEEDNAEKYSLLKMTLMQLLLTGKIRV
jgi:type I restriction enzyme, S subunit